jgi:hypothetical protein
VKEEKKKKKEEESKSPKSSPHKDLFLSTLSRDSKSLRSVLKSIKKGKQEKGLRKATKKWILENIQVSLDANGNLSLNFNQ